MISRYVKDKLERFSSIQKLYIESGNVLRARELIT
jgi:hypothetical protein